MRRLIPLLLLLASCTQAPEEGIHGYLEADYIDLAAEVAGRLTDCADKGMQLAAGAIAFRLDDKPEAIELEQRRAEAAAFAARRDEANAAQRLAEAELKRLQTLSRKDFVSAQALDKARANLERSRAAFRAAAASLEAAEKGIRRLQWIIAQKQQRTRVPARVERRFFEPGEWVAPGRSVVRLLPAGAIKAIIFVPETRLAGIATGQAIRLHVDGIDEPIPARISHIASEPEFTPPVIYSEDERATLVYRVEAGIAPEHQRSLHPGQPVDAVIP